MTDERHRITIEFWAVDIGEVMDVLTFVLIDGSEIRVPRDKLISAVKADRPYHPFEETGGGHIWSITSPMRCVVCRRYLLPWHRRLRAWWCRR